MSASRAVLKKDGLSGIEFTGVVFGLNSRMVDLAGARNALKRDYVFALISGFSALRRRV